MLRDKFGAKYPQKRDAQVRSLAFDIDKVKDQSYIKDTKPTKIDCTPIDSDSNGCNNQTLFTRFIQSIQENDNVHEDSDIKELSYNNNQEIEIQNKGSLFSVNNYCNKKEDIIQAFQILSLQSLQSLKQKKIGQRTWNHPLTYRHEEVK